MCLQAPFLPSTTHLLYHFQDIFLKHKHDGDKRSPLLKSHLPPTHSPAPGPGLQLYLSTLLFPRYTCGPPTPPVCSAGYRGTMFFCTFLSWLILSPLPRSSADSLLQAQSYSDVSLSAFLSCCRRPYKPLPCHDRTSRMIPFFCSFLQRTCLHSYKHLKKDTLPCFFLNSLNLAQFEAQGWCSEMFPPLNLIDPNKNPVKPITCLLSLGSSYLNCSLLVPFQSG